MPALSIRSGSLQSRITPAAITVPPAGSSGATIRSRNSGSQTQSSLTSTSASPPARSAPRLQARE
jgi:hypothetical protein